MIVFGTGKKQISAFSIGNNEYQLMGSYFQLYYMPVFPTGKHLYTRIGGGWEKVELDSPDGRLAMNEPGVKTGYGIGFYYGSLVILGILLFAFFMYKRATRPYSYSSRDYENIELSPEAQAIVEKSKVWHSIMQHPKEGDHFIMRIPDMKYAYTVQRIVAIEGDSLWMEGLKRPWMTEDSAARIISYEIYKDEEVWSNFRYPYVVSDLERIYQTPDSLSNKAKGVILLPLRPGVNLE